VVVEGRDLVDLGHRHVDLARQRHQVRLAQGAERVVQAVQVFDQQVAAPAFGRPRAEALAHLVPGRLVGLAALELAVAPDALAQLLGRGQRHGLRLARRDRIGHCVGLSLTHAGLAQGWVCSAAPQPRQEPTMPPRLTAQDFDQELLILFDAYVHGDVDRRGFLERAQRFAKAGVTAAGLLASLSPNFALGQQVKPDDNRLKTEFVTLPSPAGYGQVRGYLARPASAGANKLPAVLVIHENRGLNPHIEDITRRLALDGFMAFAPDALFPIGGYPGDEDKARNAFATLDQAKTREDFLAAAAWLRARADGNGKMGAVGFCYGGGIVHWLATRLPDLNAGVPFYGNTPAPEEAAKVKAPLLVQLAAVDERINAAWPAYEAALKASGARYQMFQYPGTQHGFNNDTTPRYDAAAAKQAWDRTIAFLKSNLA
jgi:carboxymethylenebutenolidase